MGMSHRATTDSKWSGAMAMTLRAVAIAGSLFHLYTLGVRPIDHLVFRSTHLFLASLLVLSRSQRGRKGPKKGMVSAMDITLVLLSLASWIYFATQSQTIHFRAGIFPTTWDVVFGFLTIVVLLEMARRTGGSALSILAIIALIYAMVGQYIPGILGHRGSDFPTVVSFLYSPTGIYSSMLGVAATYVVLYVIFSAFLNVSGAGQFFIDLSYSLAGRLRGGPAKVAIIASALFGTINGSTTTNVLATGTFTIPLMKRAGYQPRFAGAVEAVASCGGQIMPPIMGVAAFLIVENLGVPYLQVMKAALIPALVYFFGLFCAVDFEAARTNLLVVPAEDLPRLSDVLRRGWHLLLPVALLVTSLVVLKQSPIRAAFWGIGGAVVASWFREETRVGINKVLDALEEGMRGAIVTSAVCGVAGIVVGVLYLTGLGIKFATVLLEYSYGLLPLALVLVMVVTIVLGMGLPTVAAYGIPAAVLAPGLVKMGVPPLAAHMFIFYFSCISTITPPVALGAFAAAPLAGASPSEVGWTAWRLGLVAFIIPFMFIYGPPLLFAGTGWEIALAVITALTGTLCLSGSLVGWLFGRCTALERVVLFGLAFLMIKPGLGTDIIGIAGLILVFLLRRVLDRRTLSAAGPRV